MLTQPQNCTGWPEPRFWIESQLWWTDAGHNISIEAESRHFHIGGCIPYNQTLSGKVTFDILAQLHNNQDHIIKEIYFLAPLPSNATGIILDTSNHKIGTTGPIKFGCSQPTCMDVYRIEVDTSLIPQDCTSALRLRAETALADGVQPNLNIGNGYVYAPELSFKVHISNGKPACPVRASPDYVPEIPTIAAGFNDFPWSYTRLSVFKDALPTKPLSGNWTIRQLMSFDQRLFNRVSPVVAPVTRSFVTLNPKFHVMDPMSGMPMPVLGSVQLDVKDMIYRNLVIDTTKLANGRNIFFFRTDAFVEPGTILPDTIPWLPGVNHTFSGGKPHPGGTSSAVLAFAFFVNNPMPSMSMS
ncbi:hypothetical protein HYH02_008595 [Chlamydomonas schloesseri]|uniref:Uncharacterized protein n=1 Tax=Chlamydomonas schloesseri TaxID=2026947 RepID=A0A835WGK0_9CHLO|nr:hypothetical protein HYH02_008595 [Chlamydomonas schloesseri]|eukprot:KAG2446610.1 hypothetical protein HYH02_008595 [Chlamydomonas schloesseri]